MFLAESDKYILQRQLQHKLGLFRKFIQFYTIRNSFPLIDWAEYQIQSKDFVRVELLNFLPVYQAVANLVFRAEKENRKLLAGA